MPTFLALGGVGHYREPAPGLRGARDERLRVHVAVRRIRRPWFLAVPRVPVVLEPHVVSELMREDNAAATVERGDAVRAGDNGYSASAVGGAPVDDQVHEVGPGPVAQGERLIQGAVAPPFETAEIDTAGLLRVRHLGPAYQRQALVHPARRVGLVWSRRSSGRSPPRSRRRRRPPPRARRAYRRRPRRLSRPFPCTADRRT